MPMNIAIVGSRKFQDLDAVRRYVRSLVRATDAVITGGSEGVDTAAEEEAKSLRISRMVFEPAVAPGASRGEYTRALLARNVTIVNHCDMLVAFWDGESRGTLYTIQRAKAAGKPVRIVRS